jgi:hypothetical protein
VTSWGQSSALALDLITGPADSLGPHRLVSLPWCLLDYVVINAHGTLRKILRRNLMLRDNPRVWVPRLGHSSWNLVMVPVSSPRSHYKQLPGELAPYCFRVAILLLLSTCSILRLSLQELMMALSVFGFLSWFLDVFVHDDVWCLKKKVPYLMSPSWKGCLLLMYFLHGLQRWVLLTQWKLWEAI